MKSLAASRRKCTTATQAGKGFGAAKPKPSKPDPSNSKTQDRELAAALSQSKRPQRRADVRPVDEREAAKGRVDFAQIKDWGNGDQASLGNLKVQSFTESYSGEDDRPFYEQLARTLELAQKRGLLKVTDRGEPFPPFERWVFKPDHYAQYLLDQLVVHRALAAACSEAVQYSSGPSAAANQPEDSSSSLTAIVEALRPFCDGGALNRAAALQKDVTNYAVSPVMAAFGGKSRDGQEPGGMATSYAALIQRLGRAASASAETTQEREEALAKLFAYAYCIHATHLTTGMRIGAAATEKLDLLHSRAMHFYSDFPEEMTDPLAAFIQLINETGAAASKAQRLLISDEVPGGLLKTSLLLAGIARDK